MQEDDTFLTTVEIQPTIKKIINAVFFRNAKHAKDIKDNITTRSDFLQFLC